MVRRLAFLCLAYWVAWPSCNGQTTSEALVFLNNYDAPAPIFFLNGTNTELAPLGTLVQVLARPVGSNVAFSVLKERSAAGLSTFAVFPDRGYFDGGDAAVPGVSAKSPAEFVIRAWRGASDWESALTNMLAFVGQSAAFTNLTGYDPFPAAGPEPARLTNAPSFTVYPFPDACRLVPFVGPRPLCMDVSANGQALAFTWPDLGTNYIYSLEFKPSLTATNWMPVPGTTWPARTNQFILPNPPAAPSFYRVRAQAMQ